MSSGLSPLQDVRALMNRRNLAKIPTDQQKLLDRTDSWAGNLRSEPPFVPDHVLKTIREAYLARTDTQENNENLFNGHYHGSTTNGHEPDAVSKPSPAPESSPPRPENPPSSDPPERVLSWTPSPERAGCWHKPADVGSRITGDTPTAPPMAPPPRPTPPPQPAISASFPSSDNEEDLETEIPQAQSVPRAAVNGEATHLPPPQTIPSSLSENTPPCAQPQQSVLSSSWATQTVVPMTVQRHSPQPEPSGVRQPRKRRMKPIRFSDTSPVAVKTANVSASSSRSMQFTGVLESVESSLSGSRPESSPFIVPQSPTQSTAAIHIDHARAQDIESPIHDNQIDEAGYGNQTIVYVSQAVQTAQTGQHDDSLPPETEQPSTRQPSAPSVSSPVGGDTDPFRAFNTMYPEYTTRYAGCLWNFVMACVSLQFLQGEKLLRELLYDDFIRTYSSGYLPYCQTKPDPDLSSVEWFNSLSEDLLFERRVVTRENLDSILAAYPTQVSRARDFVKGNIEDQTAESGAAAPNTSAGGAQPLPRPLAGPGQPLTATGPTDVGEPSPSTPEITMNDQPATVEESLNVEQPHRHPPVSAVENNGDPKDCTCSTKPPEPRSPHSEMQSTTAHSGLSASLPPAPASRGRAAPYYFNRAASGQRSSSVRTPEEEEARRARLRKFMMQKRRSSGAASASSHKT